MSAPTKPRRASFPAPMVTVECPICGRMDIGDHVGGAECRRCHVRWPFLDGPGETTDRDVEQCASEIRRGEDKPCRCILSVGHTRKHTGGPIDDNGDDLGGDDLDEWTDADAAKHPNTKPAEWAGRQFLIGDPEPDEVAAVLDRDDSRWTRDAMGRWRTDGGTSLSWPALLVHWGPARELIVEMAGAA